MLMLTLISNFNLGCLLAQAVNYQRNCAVKVAHRHKSVCKEVAARRRLPQLSFVPAEFWPQLSARLDAAPAARRPKFVILAVVAHHRLQFPSGLVFALQDCPRPNPASLDALHVARRLKSASKAVAVHHHLRRFLSRSARPVSR